eukprot:scaffold56323_cov66-Phaeocystis_antarctica.AAC.2
MPPPSSSHTITACVSPFPSASNTLADSAISEATVEGEQHLLPVTSIAQQHPCCGSCLKSLLSLLSGLKLDCTQLYSVLQKRCLGGLAGQKCRHGQPRAPRIATCIVVEQHMPQPPIEDTVSGLTATRLLAPRSRRGHTLRQSPRRTPSPRAVACVCSTARRHRRLHRRRLLRCPLRPPRPPRRRRPTSPRQAASHLCQL